MAKVLANRLRMVIDSVISESQIAFVKDRQIIDGILIANEVVDEARKSKNELLLFKVDFEKAYDSVDWGYLDAVMGRMSFPFLWRIGLQDTISIFHLQFTDDTLLLWTKSWANIRALRAVLVLFEMMSGLKMNFNKSMLVGVNIPDSWLHEAAPALRCKVGKVSFLYLGHPIGGDPRRLGFWEPVVTRIKHRLFRWKSCFLSFGGRLILLKSVLTSLHVYALSFFKALLGGIGGGWFGECVSKKVGDGLDTFFWTNPWLGGRPLSERFRRLLDLAENKSSTVAEIFSLGWEADGEAWVWRR
ncbi:cysteine-rich receptor-like protein kinase [Trifolium medium]|uniref:Cysteine-rich receptor-like protein kinase n=1 Tax=Trifolium medium TaxID=97028 RepID=A0A392M8Q2_9FABA|nr:cysteine-rich receptor-like protein kinase [Trifolium medium]